MDDALTSTREGMVLGGTYRLERLIGAGGMGSVYEAVHLRVPRRFAVKLLNPELVNNREIFERFRREAEIAGALGHEHIVQVFDFNYADGGVPYMVLELLSGEDLSKRLERGRLTLVASLRILEQVTSALEAAHEGGIVHRDLKPQNIFLCRTRSGRDNFAKVLDFGISKIVHSFNGVTRTGSVFGTPNYMAPEQAEGRQGDIDARSDLFSLGAIAYECLSGSRAFDAPTPMGTLYQVCHSVPRPLRELVPEVPEAVEQVIVKALAKKRDDRYANAAEFRQALLDAAGIPAINPQMDVSKPLQLDPAAIVSSPPDTLSPRVATVPPKTGFRLRRQHWPWIAGAVLGLLLSIAVVRRGENHPAAQPVAKPAVAATSVPVPTTVQVRLRLDPADARVELDGKVETDNPMQLVPSSASRELVISAPGYTSLRRQIRVESPMEIPITLEKTPEPPTRHKSKHHHRTKRILGPVEDDL